jgi:hypothetical protein
MPIENHGLSLYTAEFYADGFPLLAFFGTIDWIAYLEILNAQTGAIYNIIIVVAIGAVITQSKIVPILFFASSSSTVSARPNFNLEW